MDILKKNTLKKEQNPKDKNYGPAKVVYSSTIGTITYQDQCQKKWDKNLIKIKNEMIRWDSKQFANTAKAMKQQGLRHCSPVKRTKRYIL
jgi:hypothetical protein